MSTTPPPHCSWVSRSPETTFALAEALARCVEDRLAAGFVIALIGELGCGKTVFAKGLAAGLGIDPEGVASPTFTLAGEYPARGGARFAHVDLYRVESSAELEAAGFDDLLDSGTLLAVEWGDRFPRALPEDRLELRFERGLARAAEVGEDSGPPLEPGANAEPARTLRASACGPIAEAVLLRWSEAAAEIGERARAAANEEVAAGEDRPG